jgi:hypothetical protein
MSSVLKIALFERWILVVKNMAAAKLVALYFFTFAQILRIIAQRLTFHIGWIVRNDSRRIVPGYSLSLLLHHNGVGRLSWHQLVSLHHFEQISLMKFLGFVS